MEYPLLTCRLCINWFVWIFHISIIVFALTSQSGLTNKLSLDLSICFVFLRVIFLIFV
jgi:hypothetical protein